VTKASTYEQFEAFNQTQGKGTGEGNVPTVEVDQARTHPSLTLPEKN
jgi:hypothetical protein